MNFKEDFEYYLQKKFNELELDYPYTIEEIVRHVDINYIIPLQAECFKLNKSINDLLETGSSKLSIELLKKEQSKH